MNKKQLIEAWLGAKSAEAEAAALRRSIEADLAVLMPAASTEQSVTDRVDGYRVVVKYGVTRKVDTEKLQALWGDLPPKAQDAFRWRAEVATPKLRALQEFMPADYARLAEIITVTPSKPSVAIDILEPEAA